MRTVLRLLWLRMEMMAIEQYLQFNWWWIIKLNIYIYAGIAASLLVGELVGRKNSVIFQFGGVFFSVYVSQ